MANNVIDELSLNISANASSAISNLSRLQGNLRSFAKTIGTVSSATAGLGKTFSALSHINVGSLGKAINELERLEKINLKNLDGKTIKLDIKVNGASQAEREIQSLKSAFDSVNPNKYADKLAAMFNITDKGAIKNLRAQFQGALKGLMDGNMSFDEKGIFSVIAENGRVAKAQFDAHIASMQGRYKEFLDYVNNHKFYVDSLSDVRSGANLFSADEGLARYFTTTKSAGVELNSIWAELTSHAHGFGDVFDSVNNKTGKMASLIENDKAQADALANTILAVKDAMDSVDPSKLSPDQFNQTVRYGTQSTFANMVDEFDRKQREALANSAGKIPLDIKIDPARIEQQIASAVKQASNRKYDLPIKLEVDTRSLKSKITTAIGGIDVSQLGSLSSYLKESAQSLAGMGVADFKSNGLTNFVNSMTRLASVDMSKFSGGAMESIVSTINQISSMGDISAGVNRLVASLARLANAGGSIGNVKENIVPLGKALREVVQGFSSSGGLAAIFGKGFNGTINATINQFVSSLAQLANAGDKTQKTASQLNVLAQAIIDFMQSMQNAPMVSQNVLSMVQAIGQIASSGSAAGTAANALNKNMSAASPAARKVAAGFSMVGSALRALEPAYNRVASSAMNFAKIGATKLISVFDPRQMIQPFKSLGDAINGVTGQAKMMITTMLGFRGLMGIFRGLKTSIMQGADVTEIDHIIESVFTKDMVGYVHEWSHTAIEEFGIAENAAKRMAGTLSAMFQASKIGQNDAGKMGMDLTGLAGDLSAFYNIDTETAFNKIRSGMAGMVRPLRDLGIDLTAATLQEYALSQGITTAYSAMSQAEKVMLRYNYLMSVTKTQQGDFSRTSLSLANSMRTLKAYASAVSTQIGVGLGSALRHVIVGLNQLMKYILKAAKAFATFMQTIFGKYKGGASGMAVDMSMAEESTDGLGDAAGSAADGLDNAADSAKELKKELAVLPFDELNQLSKDMDSASSGSGGGGGAGGGAGGGGITDGLLDWEDMLGTSKLPDAISEWGDRIKAAFKAKDWEALGGAIAWGINKGIDKLYDVLDPVKFKQKVDPFLNAFTRTFNSLVDNIHWEKMGRTVGRGVNNIVWTLNKLIEGIDWTNMGKKFAEGANGLVDEIDFRLVGNLIGNKFMIVWNILYGFAKKFDWSNFGRNLADGINGINEKISWSRVAATLTTFINGIFETIKRLAQDVKWHDIGKNIAGGLNTAIYTLRGEDWGKSLGSLMNKILDEINYIISVTNWERLGEQIAKFLQEIPWGKLLYTVGHAIVTALGGILKGMMKTPAGAMAAGLIVAINAFKIGSALNPFVGKLVSAFTGSQVINPLGRGVVGMLRSVFNKGSLETVQIWILYLKDYLVSGFSKLSSLLSPIVGKIGSVIQTIGSSTVGAATLTGGAIAGLMLAAQKMSEKIDELKGGNGKLTDMGTALHEYTDKLAGATAVSGKEADKLFQIIEQMENSHASESEMAQRLAEELQNMGVSYGQAKGYLDAYKQSGDQNTTMLEALETAMSNVYGEMDAQMESNDTYAQGMERLRDALYDAAAGNDQISANMPTLTAALSDAETHSATTADAYDLMKQRLEDYGITADQAPALFAVLNSELDHNAQVAKANADTTEESVDRTWFAFESGIRKVHDALVEHATDLTNTQEYAKTELDNWQSHVQAFYNESLEKFKGIGDGWGQLASDQSQSLESLNTNLEENMAKQSTALENMKKLNEAGLDGATVQAILNQIDPSSQAMTDLIGHMQADDATWQEFHGNLQQQMSMTDDVTKTLEEMTTAYAKGIAPAFAVIGPDFQTEGGKIGGFMIAGVAGGVYDNIDQAKTAMSDAANISLDAFKNAAGIASPSTKMFENGMYLDQGLASGITSYAYLVTKAIDMLNTAVANKFTPEPQKWFTAGQNMMQKLANAISGNAPIISQAFAVVNKTFENEKSTIGKYGTSTAQLFVSNFKSGMSGLNGYVKDVLNDVLDTISGLDSSFETVGRNLGNALADGFASIDIPTPHMYISGWDYTDMGDGESIQTPVFDISWYRAGGLFRNASVIGVGEDGDEAVLPLTNRRTMGMIADSIIDSANGGIGIDPNVLAGAVADGVAEAMVSIQGEQQSPIFHIEVKTEDNETLARAVTRGQQSIDYRNNPTPKMA